MAADLSHQQLPETAAHVAEQSNSRTHTSVARDTLERLAYYANHPAEIDARLEALDREWNIERALQSNAAALVLAGTALASVHSRRWLVLPATVSAFLLQHALQGWCPPLPVLRSVGFRTPREIEIERVALKALRGDFRDLEVDDPALAAEVAKMS